jgi:hypothetical protein
VDPLRQYTPKLSRRRAAPATGDQSLLGKLINPNSSATFLLIMIKKLLTEKIFCILMLALSSCDGRAAAIG